MIRKLLLSLFAILNFVSVHSQADTLAIMEYIEVSKEYFGTELDSAEVYANKAIEQSQEINFYKGLGYGYSNLGIVNEYRGLYAQSILDYQKSKTYFEKGNFGSVFSIYFTRSDLRISGIFSSSS